MKPKRKRKSIDQSVNIDQSGNDNKVTVDYQNLAPPVTDEEIKAMHTLMEAQSDLIRIYHKRDNK